MFLTKPQNQVGVGGNDLSKIVTEEKQSQDVCILKWQGLCAPRAPGVISLVPKRSQCYWMVALTWHTGGFPAPTPGRPNLSLGSTHLQSCEETKPTGKGRERLSGWLFAYFYFVVCSVYMHMCLQCLCVSLEVREVRGSGALTYPSLLSSLR